MIDIGRAFLFLLLLSSDNNTLLINAVPLLQTFRFTCYAIENWIPAVNALKSQD